MGKHFAVFQHTPWEGPGKYLVQAAKRYKAALEVFQVWDNFLPNLNNFDGFILLGGIPNVNEEDNFPFLIKEKKALRSIMKADKPCLGICLGHQLWHILRIAN